MGSPDELARLRAVLERAQAEGALGGRPVDDVITHALDFAEALPGDARTVLDLGSGAGVPGLVVAFARPEVHVTLVDRRAKRVDALHRAISSLGWTHRVTATCREAEQLVEDPGWRARFDGVMARGFAGPEPTLRIASQLARHGGWVIISEPPEETPSRWQPEWCRQYRTSLPERCGRVVRFHVDHGHHPDQDVPRGTAE